MDDFLILQATLSNKLTEKKWMFHSEFFPNGEVNIQSINRINKSSKTPIVVLDRNIFSRLLNIATRGITSEGNINDVAVLISWCLINNLNIMPYFAINEQANILNEEAQYEYVVFDKIFKEITPLMWFALALGFEKENKQLIRVSKEERIEKIEFAEISIDYLFNYLAMLHLVYVIKTEKDYINQFYSFFEWYYDNLLVSRFTEGYVASLLANEKDFVKPKKAGSKDYEKIILGCKNQARDLTYLSMTSLDRWPAEVEFIFVTDDYMLGQIYIRGQGEKEPIRIFEKTIKKNNRKVSKWVDELKRKHVKLNLVNNEYENYCLAKIAEEENKLRSIIELFDLE